MKNKIDNLYKEIRRLMKNYDNGFQGSYTNAEIFQITAIIRDIAYF